MRPEFLRADFSAPPRRPRLGMAILLGAAALIVATASQWRDVGARRAAVDVPLAARDDARRRAALPTPAPVPTQAERRLVRAAELARPPWMQTLRALERVTEQPVHLLSLTVAPGRGSVRLEAEAPTYADVLAYLRALNGIEGLSRARLVSHEPARSAARGPAQIRFGVVADWTSP